MSVVTRYAIAILTTAATTGVVLTVQPIIEPHASPPFLLAVLLVAWFAGFGPALLTCALSGVSLDYFFLPPADAFNLGWHDVRSLAVFGSVALVMAWLAATLRRSRDERAELLARERAAHAAAVAARGAAETANHAKNEFLAILAHELRNPLSAIIAAAHVLERVGKPDDAAVAARQIVDRQAHHVARLVDDLVDVNRLMTGKVALDLRPLELAAAVRRCVATVSASGKLERHAVRVETDPVWVEADTVRLDQVVINLLENAAKYTPAGGSIVVTVRRERGEAVIELRDTGVGIPGDLLPRIFEPFVQGDPSVRPTTGGLGVGLAVVRSVVRMLGGTVDAASDGPGLGSRFTVRLASITPPRSAAAPPAADASPPRRRRVLVTDDDDDTRAMLAAALALNGHEVYGASDGERALELARRVRPEVVVLDIALAGLDGYEVARRLRAMPRHAPALLIALTGYGRTEDRALAADAGFDAYLTKPIDPAELARIVAESSAARG
jgi:signal transduction histidine kinase/CheY-like chemotaxis protein